MALLMPIRFCPQQHFPNDNGHQHGHTIYEPLAVFFEDGDSNEHAVTRNSNGRCRRPVHPIPALRQCQETL